jgi:hypothetical protein
MPNLDDENIKQLIKDQIAFNSGKNLLASEEVNTLQLIEVTESLVETIRNMDAETEKEMIDYLADEALQEFCRVNQYFSFNTESVNELKAIYSLLNENIRALDNNADQATLNVLSQQHYANLCDWLVKTNGFAGKIYDHNEETVQPVACSEYAPDLQLSLLHIDLNTLLQPILDIGCGRELNLVNYLRDNGFEAYGIDRFENENPYYTKADWLEYDYEPAKWGTIISNLGFSNHFVHHNLRADGNYQEYARKYMEILAALQVGGSFHYAPDLPFIEKHLDKNKYLHSGFTIEGYEFRTSQVLVKN